MEKRNKYIILFLIIVIVIPLAYLGISGYLHDLEVQTFYNSIKEISDVENKTDSEGTVLHNQSYPSNKDIKEYTIKSINTTSTEILMLQDLKTKVSNESYIDFIEIQINRLNSENRTYTAMLEVSNIYGQFQNGEITASKGLSIVNDKSKEISSYSNKTAEFKIEADTFLSTHTDMKEKFNQLGIDEDFIFEQIETANFKRIT